jgi:hypothetical protein
MPQVAGRPIEVIIPHDSTAGSLEVLKAEFPGALFADMGTVQTTARAGTYAAAHEIYDYRRTFALNLARGAILVLLDDSAAPDPDWCNQVLAAHRELPYGVIGGAVEYEGRGLVDQAAFLQDFGRYQGPMTEGPAHQLTDINVSYKRQDLFAVRALWQKRYSEATVHWGMARAGHILWQRPQIVVRLDRGRLPLGRTIAERYCWGRLFGSVRARESSWSARLLYASLSPALPLLLLYRIGKKAHASGRLAGFFKALLPLLILIPAWCLGEFMGNLSGRDS